MHFWQLAISSLPELAIVKWTFSWFWRVVWFSLDANSVIYFYLLFVAKKILASFLCYMYLIIVQYMSLISFWIVDQLKIVMKGEGFKRKKERKIEETVSLNISDIDKLSIPAITSHGNQVNTTSTLRQGQNRKRYWETSTHNCYNCHYGEPQC